MCPAPVSAASTARALPPVVESGPRAVLLCTPTRREHAKETAAALAARGFDVSIQAGSFTEVVEGVSALHREAGPVLLVPCGPDMDTPVLRSRIRRALSGPHEWLAPATDVRQLERALSARTTTAKPRASHADVVPFPAPPESEPGRRKPSKVHLVLWPLVGASLTAMTMAALQTDPRPSAPAEEAAVERVVAPMIEPTPSALEPPPRSMTVPPPPRALPVLAPPPEPTSEPSTQVAAALAHERVTATDDALVFTVGERPRDWFAAMDVCRGRAHAGLRGWRTPTSRQLHALAKARVLPPSALWSRTRSARADDTAFVVHGRAGTTRSALKTETVDDAVCLRPRDLPPKGT